MNIEYRLATYVSENGAARAGVVVGDEIYDIRDVLGRDVTVLELLERWDESDAAIADRIGTGLVANAGQLSETRLLAPILYPSNFYCAGANYWDHLSEMGDFIRETTGKAPILEKAAEPWHFVKTTRGTIVGDNQPVTLPRFSNAIDWEAEIGVVMGRQTKEITEDRAMEAVAGYVIVNDLSARDHIKREGSPFVYDWIGQKCWDGAAPMGPWITPARFVRNPSELSIKLWVNDDIKQDSNSSQMVHSIAEQIAYLSRHVTLYPGDVIATGTPAGVGMPKGEFLKPGDVVSIEVAGLGKVTNSMVPA